MSSGLEGLLRGHKQMIKHRLHENGWTVLLEDVDLTQVSQEDVNDIAKLMMTHTTVVARGQSMSPVQELEFCQKFGRVQHFDQKMNPGFVLEGTNGGVLRVTGGLDEHGRPGMFGHVEELQWHCNRVSDPDRMPIVFLYSDKNTKGSVTSFLNNIASYNDLSEEFKQRINDYHLDVGPVQQMTSYYYDDGYEPIRLDDWKPPLVHTNAMGIKGLFFSWFQTHFIQELGKEESRELIEHLREHCEQDKYIYDHHWEDGDVVISDQWQSIHRRWAYEHMDKRLVHRVAMDYSKIQ